eukprot:Gb_08043 [translate_table: standard]
MPNANKQKCLKLATLDFNIIQSLQQEELKLISRFCTDTGLREIAFFRQRLVEAYFATASFEPEFCGSRIAFTKLVFLLTFLDDIYDTYGTLDELELLTQTLKRFRWDLSIWEDYFKSYFEEGKWTSAQHVPTFDDYLQDAVVSIGFRVLMLYSVLFMDIMLPDNILQQVDFPSKLPELIALTWRLSNDTRSQDEKARGELVSCITSNLKDNPGSTEEDALNHIYGLNDQALKESTLEFFKLDNATGSHSLVVPVAMRCHGMASFEDDMPWHFPACSGHAPTRLQPIFSIADFAQRPKPPLYRSQVARFGPGKKIIGLFVAASKPFHIGFKLVETLKRWFNENAAEYAYMASHLVSDEIRAFMTHCGWNSSMEAMTAGIPLIALPMQYDQPMNVRLIVGELEVGVEVERGSDGSLNREEIVKFVRKAMADNSKVAGFGPGKKIIGLICGCIKTVACGKKLTPYGRNGKNENENIAPVYTKSVSFSAFLAYEYHQLGDIILLEGDFYKKNSKGG